MRHFSITIYFRKPDVIKKLNVITILKKKTIKKIISILIFLLDYNLIK